MLSPDLTGRTALVTGSSRGLGKHTLLALAECGADVAVHYRTSEDAASAVADRAREHGVNARTVEGDVTDSASVDTLFETVEADLGPVDILVNNVGAFAPRHWTDLDEADWERVIETNLYGTYRCSKRALPGLVDAADGRVVNVGYASSEKGLVSPKNFPYFVAKADVIMFTRMLAADLSEDGVSVNTVSPYVIENSNVYPDALPRDRPASFADVVQAILFFLAPDSAYISGQNLEVHGGWLPERV